MIDVDGKPGETDGNYNYDNKHLQNIKRNKNYLLISGIFCCFLIGLIGYDRYRIYPLVGDRVLSAILSFLGYYWIILDSEQYEIGFSSAQKKALVLINPIMAVWYFVKTRRKNAGSSIVKLFGYGIILFISEIIGSIINGIEG